MNLENFYNREELLQIVGDKSTLNRLLHKMEDSGRYPPTDFIWDQNILLVRHEALADWVYVRKRIKKKQYPIPPYKRRK